MTGSGSGTRKPGQGGRHPHQFRTWMLWMAACGVLLLHGTPGLGASVTCWKCTLETHSDCVSDYPWRNKDAKPVECPSKDDGCMIYHYEKPNPEKPDQPLKFGGQRCICEAEHHCFSQFHGSEIKERKDTVVNLSWTGFRKCMEDYYRIESQQEKGETGEGTGAGTGTGTEAVTTDPGDWITVSILYCKDDECNWNSAGRNEGARMEGKVTPVLVMILISLNIILISLF